MVLQGRGGLFTTGKLFEGLRFISNVVKVRAAEADQGKVGLDLGLGRVVVCTVLLASHGVV